MTITELIEKHSGDEWPHGSTDVLKQFAIELLEMVKEDSKKALFDPLHKLSINKALEEMRK